MRSLKGVPAELLAAGMREHLIGLTFFALALYAFFENFSRLLRSNY